MRVGMLVLLFASFALAGNSENPPEGPPWKRDLLAAQKEALERGLPVFFYFTKTY